MNNIKTSRRKSSHGAPMQFIEEVALRHEGDACLIWPFARMGKGYGHVRQGKQMIGAHRVVCEKAHGTAPSPEHEAAHSCGRGFDACVSPHHLAWKTPAENNADKLLHGTGNRGERHGLAKLDQAAVRMIRNNESASQSELAKRFGVSVTTISRVLSGETWGWLS